MNAACQENEAYLTQQLITYLGNKRSLLDFIGIGIQKVKERLGKSKIRSLDVFSGSGIVSRYLKKDSSFLIANDMENYSGIINSCYLSNRSIVPMEELREIHKNFSGILARDENLREGFIRELYSPKDMNDIQPGERCFFTPQNAAFLDTARQMIATLPEELQKFFLGPLFSQTSIHANTSGVFKGFYKDSSTRLGQFGGTKKDALTRILGRMELVFPVFSNFECTFQVTKGDANLMVETFDEVDLAYLDPPYNQHPYGSNYFMLNLIAEYQKPSEVSLVSGIPDDWNRSEYNKRNKALETMADLVEKIRSRFLLISFNSEGFISRESMVKLLEKYGKVEILETRYNTFRGSRNLKARELHLSEYLFLVEKS